MLKNPIENINDLIMNLQDDYEDNIEVKDFEENIVDLKEKNRPPNRYFRRKNRKPRRI